MSGNKIVSITGFKPIKVAEMETLISDHAKSLGLESDILQWGGRGDLLPFFVVVCKPGLVSALRDAAKNGFLKGSKIMVEDIPLADPTIKPRNPSP